jgi:hypothetical protein
MKRWVSPQHTSANSTELNAWRMATIEMLVAIAALVGQQRQARPHRLPG